MVDPLSAFATLPDDDLAEALRGLARSVSFPSAVATGPAVADLAGRVRERIELNPPRPSIWQRLGWSVRGDRPAAGRGRRPLRRGLVIALVALLVLAAVAGAVGLGLPGLRIIFGEGPGPRPSASAGMSPGASASTANQSASLSPLGSSLGLGSPLPLDEIERLAGFEVLLPTDPAIGQPNATFLDRERVALVWATRPDLPDTESPGVGLVLSEFRGEVYGGYFEKILGSDTVVTKVTVGGSPGYWISGDPHFFMYIDPQGVTQDDDHRIVGDVLLWTKDEVTYRLETSLGKEAAIKVAESLR